MVAEQTAQRTHAETEPSTPKPSGKGGWLRRTPFPVGFAVGGAVWTPEIHNVLARKLYCVSYSADLGNRARQTSPADLDGSQG